MYFLGCNFPLSLVLRRCWANVDRWDQLRMDHGWASVQHQVLLRNTIFIPSVHHHTRTPFKLDVIQGTEYAFIPVDHDQLAPSTWYNGDVYGFAEYPSGPKDTTGITSNFSRSMSLIPGEYTFLVRAMYEIRMFGDPGYGNAPVIRLRVSTEMDDGGMEVLSGLGTCPDVVDGWLMGEWIGVAVKAPEDGKEGVVVESASLSGVEQITVDVVGPTTIRPGQTRVVPVKISQDHRLHSSITKLPIRLNIRCGIHTSSVTWSAKIQCHHQPNLKPFRITFASPSVTSSPPALVSFAMVVPPCPTSRDPTTVPVVLATHGAGVDIENDFWISAMPMTGGWAVLPTGKNEWGEDWHGASMGDVWAARDVLPHLLKRLHVKVSDETL